MKKTLLISAGISILVMLLGASCAYFKPGLSGLLCIPLFFPGIIIHILFLQEISSAVVTWVVVLISNIFFYCIVGYIINIIRSGKDKKYVNTAKTNTQSLNNKQDIYLVIGLIILVLSALMLAAFIRFFGL